MCDWVRVSTDLLEPVAHEIHRQILESEAIFADETIMKAQTQKKQGLHSGYIWGVLGPPGVYFHYSPSRAGSVAVELLSGYEGFVHTDAYAGYKEVFLPDKCARVGCFAHVRRKFIEVESSAKRDVGKILQMIAALYRVEKKIRGASVEERVRVRQKQSVVQLERLKEYLDALNTRTLPRHPLKKAINYTLKQWLELIVYTTNGHLEMDNNSVERQIRSIAVGRKNYMFVGSHDGGRRAAIMYTLINTCKMQKVNPFLYLQDILRRVATHPNSKIRELTPGNWKKLFS